MKTTRPKFRLTPSSQIPDLPGEIWKDIPGYEGLYAVSNMGRVKGYQNNNRRVALTTPKLSNAGYFRVELSKHSIEKKLSLHRLVAEAFIPNPDNLETVNHKNLDKTDNRVENLEWLSVADNIRHARNNGLNNRKPVIQMDLNGNTIKVWESAWKAQEEGPFQCSNIGACCRGKLKTHKGFKWKFL